MFAPNMVDEPYDDEMLNNYDGMDYNDWLIEQAMREREASNYSDYMS